MATLVKAFPIIQIISNDPNSLQPYYNHHIIEHFDTEKWPNKAQIKERWLKHNIKNLFFEMFPSSLYSQFLLDRSFNVLAFLFEINRANTRNKFLCGRKYIRWPITFKLFLKEAFLKTRFRPHFCHKPFLNSPQIRLKCPSLWLHGVLNTRTHSIYLAHMHVCTHRFIYLHPWFCILCYEFLKGMNYNFYVPGV